MASPVWFHGTLEPTVAEHRLEAQPVGTFLVYTSQSGQTVLAVRGPEQTVELEIEPDSGSLAISGVIAPGSADLATLISNLHDARYIFANSLNFVLPCPCLARGCAPDELRPAATLPAASSDAAEPIVPMEDVPESPGFVMHDCPHSEPWCLPGKFGDLHLIWAGRNGQVALAHDLERQTTVAIKKLVRPFDDEKSAERAYREIFLLRRLGGNRINNILTLHELISPQTCADDLNDIYIVTEYAPRNLTQVIKEHALTPDHIRLIMYRAFVGAAYLHSGGLLHRDLKPDNIGVWPDCRVKLLDFGLAQQASSPSMTLYVQTRFWRAPEVIASNYYDDKADVWSLGCILAQCYARAPVFKGRNDIKQLVEYIKVFGEPSAQFFDHFASRPVRDLLRRAIPTEFVSLESKVPGINVEALEMLQWLLAFDVGDRPTARQALEHPYFSLLHDSQFEPRCAPVQLSVRDLSLPQWKQVIFDELQLRQA
eukprot:m.65874 g.65874  ORF g.65874 m.65874 type:complete len:483 (-) comp7596_c0_seq4:111-1559(-)